MMIGFSEILKDLMDNDRSLSTALMKTKFLADSLDNKELLKWVDAELSGYLSENNLPIYRKFIGNIKGNYIQGGYNYTNASIPLVGFDDVFEDSLRSINFTESVNALEALRNKDDGNFVGSEFNAEIIGLIQSNLNNINRHKIRILSCQKIITSNTIVEILTSIRTHLLNLMLDLNKQFGNLKDLEELLSYKKEINTIMSQIIINTSGDGNIVNTGDNNQITSSVKITKGNIEELKSKLIENGVGEDDALELISIVQEEDTISDQKQFGPKVNSWIEKMIGKSLDSSWKIGIATAGGFLSGVLKNYYGF